MENIGIPIIVLCCYMIGELYKLIFKNKDVYKIIPIITSISGGILGIVIYFTNPSVLSISSYLESSIFSRILICFSFNTGKTNVIL